MRVQRLPGWVPSTPFYCACARVRARRVWTLVWLRVAWLPSTRDPESRKGTPTPARTRSRRSFTGAHATRVSAPRSLLTRRATPLSLPDCEPRPTADLKPRLSTSMLPIVRRPSRRLAPMRTSLYPFFALLGLVLLLVCAGSVGGLVAGARAQTAPPVEDVRLVGGLDQPTAMAFAPDGRIFVAQQGGALRVVKNGACSRRRS